MKGHGSKFTRKMEEAVAALLSQRNQDEAARSISVGPATLRRWIQLPEFQAALRKARRNAYSQTVARLQQASSAAASLLLKIVVDTNVAASTRVRAAEIVLDKTAKAIEIEDIEARVSELERAAGASKQSR